MKSARLEARISVEQKSLIEQAAAFEGRTVTDFVVQAVDRAARQVVQEHATLRLNREQSRSFVERLLTAERPNARLKAAARKHKRQVDSR
jgi:uncharacterized protein (DUF1778 family)